MKEILDEDYRFLTEFVRDRTGIVIGADQQYLVVTRLSPILTRLSISGYSELIQQIRTGRIDPATLVELTDAMTTNESLFFRDGKPFDVLAEKILPDLMRSRASARRIRIWSAACSNGQEPYSIAIKALESVPGILDWTVDILGSDISESVLKKAREANYSAFEVQRGVSQRVLDTYFTAAAGGWTVGERARKLVQFQSLNLVKPLPEIGSFDVIFCRNVLIYFDVETKRFVLEQLARRLAPDGYLFLGGAESPHGITDKLVAREGFGTPVYSPAPPNGVHHGKI